VRAPVAIERALVALALCLFALGVAVLILTAPWFVRAFVPRAEAAMATGLPPSVALSAAEGGRVFVTDPHARDLPARIGGRVAFDESAVSHLVDVREVLLGARTLTLLLGGALALWAALGIRRKRHDQVGSALRWGAVACLLLPLLLVLGTLVDFESLFTAFHGFFFAAGTWQFPPDSLLIQLFPERFWMIAASSLALFLLAEGVVFWLLGGAILPPARESERQ
jgi:integral membrane protein (TIGR01906 family)